MISQALSQFADHCTSEALFGLPSWNKYLDYGHNANGQCTLGDGFVATDIWLVAAAILEILIRVAGVVAVFYVIAGGFKFMTSQGSPDQTAQARKTIINAIAGLTIAVVAISAVSYVATTVSDNNLSALCSDTRTERLYPDDPEDTRTVEVCVEGTEIVDTQGDSIGRVLNLVYAIAGATAAIFVVIGGLKYTTASGDPQKINSSKNTIIYAIVGLVVILIASFITSYVLSSL